jgi:uncharacterized protein (TIGR02145 family)
MIKSNLLLVLYLTIFLFGKTVYAQKVSNITFHQEQSTIIVSYDLETKIPCKVSLYVSTNDGKTWEGPLVKVIGDVGAKITSGSKGITWNVLEEFEELRGDKIMFQVRASGEYIETVVIGTQEWTTKNLNVSTYRNGDVIPEVRNPKEWEELTTGAWCYFNNDPKNGAIYGKLYNWYAINDPRGLAPEGFHIASEGEWDDLVNYLGGEHSAGDKLKATNLWVKTNCAATNSSGFLAIPGGYRSQYFSSIGESGGWWSSGKNGSFVWAFTLTSDYCIVIRDGFVKDIGYSVRCLRD